MKSLPSTETPSDGEAARLEACRKLSEEMSEAFNVAIAIKETLLDIISPSQITDPRRFQIFRKLLRSADHELGKAVAK